MTYATTAQDHAYLRYRGASRTRPLLVASAVALAVLGALSGVSRLDDQRSVSPVSLPPASPPLPAERASPRYTGLLDPALARLAAPMSFAQSSPLGATLQPPPGAAAAPDAGSLPPVATDEVVEIEEMPQTAAPLVPDQSAPLPLPRPAGVGLGVDRNPSRSIGRPSVRLGSVAAPVAPADGRSFIEKLLGIPQSLRTVLAYASPEDGAIGPARGAFAPPMLSVDRLTAVYNIAAHTVTLPDGVTLEAHSGLGDRLDDPRHVDEPNRGATPPHAYDLELRSQLFHGVQAIRLNPIGGGGVFGRTGLLAHTFMLGPNGDSNGCVSFRNYNAFLQAYLNGRVRRLIVVAGR